MVGNLVTGSRRCRTVFVIWGLIGLAFWPTLLGAALIYCGTLWFFDRMAWLLGTCTRGRSIALCHWSPFPPMQNPKVVRTDRSRKRARVSRAECRPARDIPVLSRRSASRV
jgi:hypothetical protein